MSDTRNDQPINRLVMKFGISRESAVKLIDAGLTTAGPVRRATNKKLREIDLSRREIAKIRGK